MSAAPSPYTYVRVTFADGTEDAVHDVSARGDNHRLSIEHQGDVVRVILHTRDTRTGRWSRSTLGTYPSDAKFAMDDRQR